jgi:hypothetical protein
MDDPEHTEAVLIERHLATFVQRNVQGDLPCIPIERIQPFAAANPTRPRLVFSGCFDLVAAQAKRGCSDRDDNG